jgi:hypothetical protein
MTAEELQGFFTGFYEEESFIYKLPIKYSDLTLVETVVNGGKEEPPYTRFAPFTKYTTPNTPPLIYVCTNESVDHLDFELVGTIPGEAA